MNTQAAPATGATQRRAADHRLRAMALAALLGLSLGGATLQRGQHRALADSCTSIADSCTSATYSCPSATEYDYTGGSQCFLVPAGVTSVTFDVYGSQGGNGGPHGGIGGLGAEVKSTVGVRPGDMFQINVGGVGGYGPTAAGGGSPNVLGGWNGGGQGAFSHGTVTSSGGGGGGASDIRTGGDSLTERLIVAAGGGGGGGWGGDFTFRDAPAAGGQGGGMGAGQVPTQVMYGIDCTNTGGAGGAANQGGGAGDNSSSQDGCGGAGGGLTSGGQDGYKASDFDTGTGSGAADQGDNGGAPSSLAATGGGGGGGGGGYYGGGGGSFEFEIFGLGNGAGGGGGSSNVSAPASSVSILPGVQAGNGKVLVSYASTVTLQSSANPSSYYQPPTYTATVVPPVSTGSVTFLDNGILAEACRYQPIMNGVATCTLPSTYYPSVGTQQITALYNGSVSGQGLRSGRSSVLSQVVLAQTQATLSVTTLHGQPSIPSVSGQPVTLSATLDATGTPVQTPAGIVDFYADGTVIGSVLPQAVTSGTSQATLTTTSLPVGTHTLLARYRGDSTTAASVSGTISQVVQPGTLLNDTASGIIYSGSWGYSSNRGVGDYQDDEHYTTTNFDSFGDFFTGTGVRVLGETNSGGGTDEVYVDGHDEGAISTYSQSRLAQQVLYSISGLKSGQHEVKVVKTSGTYLEVDALAVLQ